jgi:hypothetical protein
MNREILKVVNRVLSEEISGRISNVKRRIFEEKTMCTECGVGRMYEGECNECGYTNEGDIQELGGMDDGHPRLGKKRLPKRMSPEEIEKLLRGDDKVSFEDDDMPNIKKMKRHKGDRDEINEYSPKDEIENNFSFYEEFCSQIHNMDHPDCEGYYRYTSKLDDKKSHKNNGEIEERLYGNQKRIDKNKNGRIDRGDFKMLRKEMYELTLDGTNKKFIFTENEIIGIIEDVILEEKKKSKTKSKPKDPIKLTKANQEKSKKENDDNIDDVVKKMTGELKNQSKGKYEMNPKHFPKGNGELAKMDKMAYVPSDSVEEYIKNFTAAGLENLSFHDGITPDEQWMTDNIEGSSRTGNGKWANSVETPVNKERNTIRKNNMLAKLKQKAYNKAPQPVVSDNGGSKQDKGSKIMMKLESTENKKVISDVDKMKSLMSYNKNSQ